MRNAWHGVVVGRGGELEGGGVAAEGEPSSLSVALRQTLHLSHAGFAACSRAAATAPEGQGRRNSLSDLAKLFLHIHKRAVSHGMFMKPDRRQSKSQVIKGTARLLARYLPRHAMGSTPWQHLTSENSSDEDVIRLLALGCHCGEQRCLPDKYGYQFTTNQLEGSSSARAAAATPCGTSFARAAATPCGTSFPRAAATPLVSIPPLIALPSSSRWRRGAAQVFFAQHCGNVERASTSLKHHVSTAKPMRF